MNATAAAGARGRRPRTRARRIGIQGVLLLALASTFSVDGSAGSSTDRLVVASHPWGPAQAELDRAGREILSHPVVRSLLGQRFRLLSIRAADEADRGIETPPSHYEAIVYDYTNARALRVRGSLSRPGDLSVRLEDDAPVPSDDEFEEAVRILRAHPLLGSPLRAGTLSPYRPMPPLVTGRPRTIAVGLLPRRGSRGHEIVGVDLLTGAVLRFPGGAPPRSRATDHICGSPGAGQATTPQGEAGAMTLTVSRGGEELWRLVVVRPSASSGTNGSGIELRYVEHRGRRLLDRAHAPIVNVFYRDGLCGPFRDWAWQEGMFEREGVDRGPGFSECAAPPRTFGETLTDEGNFRGVAVHVDGDEVVLVSELEAGWYRYISEWRLGPEGTIRPRFAFASVADSCTCATHIHHVYWRFDFPAASAVDEFNAEADGQPSGWETLALETRRERNESTDRAWRVRDLASGSGMTLTPGPADEGEETIGDVWVVRYAADEIDDGRAATSGGPVDAGIDAFVDGEPIVGEDIVLWYGAHVLHDGEDQAFDVLGVGPDLRPIQS